MLINCGFDTSYPLIINATIYGTLSKRAQHMRRKEPLEIPEAGFREILYNAIVHKQYLGVDIQMHVYNDRVEVWNEGEFVKKT